MTRGGLQAFFLDEVLVPPGAVWLGSLVPRCERERFYLGISEDKWFE